MHNTLQSIIYHQRQTVLLSSIQATLEWDERTGLPVEGAEHRAQQVTLLSGMVHARNTDLQLGKWLDELLDLDLTKDRHSVEGTIVHRLKKDFDRNTKLPQSLVERITRATLLGQQSWSIARANNDYRSFAPLLEEIFDLRRQEAKLLAKPGRPLYDALLDQYEEDAESDQIRIVFEELRTHLVPMVQRATEAKNPPSGKWFASHFDVDQQRKASHWIAEKIGFRFPRGRLDETDHPFCTTLGPNDHRILTRYASEHFNSGFFGTLHEAGHGMYEQGLPTEWFGLPPGQAASLGVHESQSRLWENSVGRSFSFWKWCFPEMQKLFPSSLAGCTVEDFYRDANRVEPSLIRVEADEATYNLHILLRFELEQEIVNETIGIDDLPEAWNDRYERYLGVRPANDADGVLQDIHWSAGLLGYFPTYTLGNLFSAQLMSAAESAVGDLNAMFAKGEFEPLLGWLRTNVHRWGRTYSPATLIQRAVGAPLSCKPWVDYLEAKLQSIR